MQRAFSVNDQETYTKNMLIKLKEDKATGLLTLAQMSEGKGATAIFYRNSLPGNLTGKLNLYPGGDQNQNKVTRTAISCALDIVESGEAIPLAEIASTNLNIKSGLYNAHLAKIKRDKEHQVLAALHADSNIPVTNVVDADGFAGDSAVKKLISTVALAVSDAVESSDHQAKVGVIMNKKDRAKLYENDVFLSSDYFKMVSGGKLSSIMDMVIYSYGNFNTELPEGTAYIVPAQSFGHGYSAAGDTATLLPSPGSSDWFAKATAFSGAEIIESDAITKIIVATS